MGLGSFILSYVPRLLRSIFVEMGIGEDLYNPVCKFPYSSVKFIPSIEIKLTIGSSLKIIVY